MPQGRYGTSVVALRENKNTPRARHATKHGASQNYNHGANLRCLMMTQLRIEIVDKFKLSQGGHFIVSVGPTPDLSNHIITRCDTKVARGAFKKRGAGCIGGASLTGAVCQDRSELRRYAHKRRHVAR